jgi:hypothetical protein
MKVVLIGKSDHKIQLLKQLHSHFDKQKTDQFRSTIGVDFSVINFNGVKLTLWDISSSNRFFSMQKIYLRDASAVLYLEPSNDQVDAVKSALNGNKDVVYLTYNRDLPPEECVAHIVDAVNRHRQEQQNSKQTRIVYDPEFSSAKTAIDLHNIL